MLACHVFVSLCMLTVPALLPDRLKYLEVQTLVHTTSRLAVCTLCADFGDTAVDLSSAFPTGCVTLDS